MTSIRFVGDLPLWIGILLAALAGLGTWFTYRRELHNLSGRQRWLLPGLRTAAVVLTLLILTGPVLHHRRLIGQLGRVVVFLDDSRSMSVNDHHMPVARKLLVAQAHGWLPATRIDTSLWDMANELAETRRDMTTKLAGQSSDANVLGPCRTSFAERMAATAARLEQFPWSTLPFDDAQSPPPWQNLAGRFRDELLLPSQSVRDVPLDSPEACQSAASRLLDLCQLLTAYEQSMLAAFDAVGTQLAASGNRSIAAALTLFDETSRWQRAESLLVGESTGLLAKLTRTHEVELLRLTRGGAEPLWSGQGTSEVPTQLSAAIGDVLTDLSTGVGNRMTSRTSGTATPDSAGTEPRTAVLLLTDGQHNSGPSPLHTARVFGERTIPIFAVGFGSGREPPDLALLNIEHPDLVFRKDRVRGTIVVKEQMPPGQPCVLQIAHENDVLWQERLTTENTPRRRVEFEFPVDEIVDKLQSRLDTRIARHSLPLTLRVSIAPVEGEAETANNERLMRLAVITQSYKLLLIDGRARWETRYLRNTFERDQQWAITTLLAGPGTDQPALPRGDGPQLFPSTEAGLFDYDVIVLGEVAPDLLADHEQTWMRDFVERRGGGIIFLDGRSGTLRQSHEETLRTLLPVSWLPAAVSPTPSRLQLTSHGANQTALLLERTSEANRLLWQELPPPRRVVSVEALPGTEVLAEAVVDGQAVPAIATRSFGAGRVVYFAFDETWRWRYKVADTYHQRFWNQLARWAMPRPFAVSDPYVSLDSGPPSYRVGESAEIRVRLRGADGRPTNDALVDALLWQDGQVVSTVVLEKDGAGRGFFVGRTGALAAGSYEVSIQAAGFASDALAARTSFVVLEPSSVELDQVACNDNLLREMAEASGGRFLREEQVAGLEELLRPLGSGRVEESETLLWQSYWWFAAIVGLLALEWLLRKRAGLL